MINTVLHPISRPTSSARAGDFLSVLLLALSVALTMVTLASA
jgi:hypothetical protein